MTTVAATWADLLEGEEIAYSGVEPSREPTLERLPDDLDPLVASALIAAGVTALFRHQAEAWCTAGRNPLLNNPTPPCGVTESPLCSTTNPGRFSAVLPSP